MLNSAIPWHKMTGREQMVWASSYTSQAGDPANAIRWADQAVRQLRELDIVYSSDADTYFQRL